MNNQHLRTWGSTLKCLTEFWKLWGCADTSCHPAWQHAPDRATPSRFPTAHPAHPTGRVPAECGYAKHLEQGHPAWAVVSYCMWQLDCVKLHLCCLFHSCVQCCLMLRPLAWVLCTPELPNSAVCWKSEQVCPFFDYIRACVSCRYWLGTALCHGSHSVFCSAQQRKEVEMPELPEFDDVESGCRVLLGVLFILLRWFIQKIFLLSQKVPVNHFHLPKRIFVLISIPINQFKCAFPPDFNIPWVGCWPGLTCSSWFTWEQH